MILTVILGILAAFVLFRCLQNYRNIQRLGGTSITRIQDLDSGNHKIKGTVSDSSRTVVSPIGSKDCVWFCIHVEEDASTKPNVTNLTLHWTSSGRFTGQGECRVDDGSGVCLVDLDDADHDCSGSTTRSESGTFDDPSEQELAVLSELGLSGENFLSLNRRFRYTETVLQCGEELFANGPCEIEVDGMAVMRTFHNTRVFFSNRSEAVLVRSHKTSLTLQFIVFLLRAFATLATLTA
jgi:hypothetical protein